MQAFMKSLILSSALFSTVALCSPGILIKNFTIVRDGGGQIKVLVTKIGDQIEAVTTSCSFRNLSKQEQAQTLFHLTGKVYDEANLIFSNEAILANDSTIRGDVETGSWQSLKIVFDETNYNGGIKQYSKKIENPLIIVDDKVSTVLDDIEELANAAATSVCN